jgi:membrane protein
MENGRSGRSTEKALRRPAGATGIGGAHPGTLRERGLTVQERLARVPRVGPAFAALFASRPYRVWEYLEDRVWTRLAAAITFTSFLTLFPAIALAAAVTAAVLSDAQVVRVEDWFTDQVPGISQQLDLRSFFANSRAIGLAALLLLLPTGAAWVDSLRGTLRAVWDLPEPDGNPLLRKVKDIGVLAGLGAVVLASLGASALAINAVHWATSWLGVERNGVAQALLQAAAYVLAMSVTFALLLYVLAWLPGVRPPRGALLGACLVGAIGIELLKLLLGGYLINIAGRSVYGAFGAPIALLVWINLIARLLLACCAWTATAVSAGERTGADVLGAAGGRRAAGGAGGTRRPPPPSGPAPRP